jgi:hypothetical protein
MNRLLLLIMLMVAGQVRAEDGKGKAPSLELLSRLRYKSMSFGGAEVRLGMSSNEVLSVLAKANLHGAWMVKNSNTPRIRQYTVAGTNSVGGLGTAMVAAGFARGDLNGYVYFRDGFCICINKVVASFRDDDRGTEFARRLIELLWTVQREEGTEKIVSGEPSVMGDIHELNFDIVPGNKRISCSATGGKFRLDGEVKDSFAPPQAELDESIYLLDSMSEISTMSGIRKFWGWRDE